MLGMLFFIQTKIKNNICSLGDSIFGFTRAGRAHDYILHFQIM